ncbi:MAG: hypothetical protein GWP10_03840 [Nitrospiraceae bacterium]|nr:hypothetical protein [Nitrospiraceae bacterium]
MNFLSRNRKIFYFFGLAALVVLAISIVDISNLFSEGDRGAYSLKHSLYRGAILDRAGTVLAVSQRSISAFARPSILPKDSDWIPEVSEILGLRPKAIKNLLTGAQDLIWLKDGLSAKECRELRDRHLNGIETVKRYRRVYPYGVLASPVLGFVGRDGRGLEGIECTYDRLLSQNNLHRFPIQGQELSLTIERGIQLLAERELVRQIKRLRANRGCFVIMDIRDGEILAMASRPSWDPRRFWEIPTADITNYSLQDDVDPAVLMPVLSWITGQKGASDQDTHPQEDAPKWGWDAIDAGLVLWGPWLERDPVPSSDLSKELWDLGFGQQTGIDLPGECQGSLPPSLSEPAFRGVMANSIQVLRAFSVLIMGVKLVRPHVALRLPKEFSPGLKDLSQAKIPWLTEGQAIRLRKRLAARRGPSLASILWSNNDKNTPSMPSSQSPAQVMALGFWPPKSPKVSYIFLLDGVKRDPRKHRGILGRPLRVAKEAAQLPM